MYRNVILVFLVVAIVSLIAASFWVSVPKREGIEIRGTTMQPTIAQGEGVYIDREFYKSNPIQRGDIVAVALDYNKEPAIMRVIAVGGDSLDFREGRIWLNGRMLSESYIIPLDYRFSENEVEVLKIQMSGEGKVPEGTLLLLNDNRNMRGDSRKLGFIPETLVVGKVIINK